MSSTPNPARLAEYHAKLAELVAARESYRAQHNDHKVTLLNREIRSQSKWISRASRQLHEAPTKPSTG
jgi:hypothetical protein